MLAKILIVDMKRFQLSQWTGVLLPCINQQEKVVQL